MKNQILSSFIMFLVACGLLFTGCKKEETVKEGVVRFATATITITTDSLSPSSFDLLIDPEAPSESSITLLVSSIGGESGTAFSTTPSITDGKIELPVAQGDTSVSVTVTPIEEGIEFDDVRIDFEILGTGPGLTTEGLSGIFASLFIQNNKTLARALPFEENFDECDEGGAGGVPSGWEEVVVLQNSLGTGQWVCSPAFDGIEANAFSSEGFEGDGCEVWLVSPRIDLSEATNPVLSFDADRRFETPDFQEYDVKISSDYDGTNFETATWAVLDTAVVAIEANDPEQDDYESLGPFDLSDYSGEMISIAFIYYAEGSKLTATILRFDTILVEEPE